MELNMVCDVYETNGYLPEMWSRTNC